MVFSFWAPEISIEYNSSEKVTWRLQISSSDLQNLVAMSRAQVVTKSRFWSTMFQALFKNIPNLEAVEFSYAPKKTASRIRTPDSVTIIWVKKDIGEIKYWVR